MLGVWSYLRQFMYTKWVIVVDDDIIARDWKDVMWAISTRMDPVRDITQARAITVSELLEEIDRSRDSANLSSAVRVFVLEYMRQQGVKGRIEQADERDDAA